MTRAKLPVAVIELGGKQYVVEQGQEVVVETKTRGKLKLTDLLAGKTVDVTLGEPRKGRKLAIVKFRSKTRELKRIGHRPAQVPVTVTKIT